MRHHHTHPSAIRVNDLSLRMVGFQQEIDKPQVPSISRIHFSDDVSPNLNNSWAEVVNFDSRRYRKIQKSQFVDSLGGFNWIWKIAMREKEQKENREKSAYRHLANNAVWVCVYVWKALCTTFMIIDASRFGIVRLNAKCSCVWCVRVGTAFDLWDFRWMRRRCDAKP